MQAILANSLPQPTLDLPHVAAAVKGLRAAGQVQYISRCLLTASLYHFVRGEHDLARKLLDEAQQIAERGPMPLFLADIHLHRARMFRDKGELAKAGKLIRELGSRNLPFIYFQEYGIGSKQTVAKEIELQQLPGYGTLDYKPIVRALREVGFTGYVEIFMHPTPRGTPMLPTPGEITKAINKSRDYIETCLKETAA